MQIKEITTNKVNYMDLLLIGDEDEKMINKFNKYINQSTIFALYAINVLTAICAVITIDNETIEKKILQHIPNTQIKVMHQH